jgi:isoleucyl-tRNA synthetase
LLDWPTEGAVDAELVGDMAAVREVISTGLALRAQFALKVRQPLASVTVGTECPTGFDDVITEELNVKAVLRAGDKVVLDTELTPPLLQEGLIREVIRNVQSARKAAGLNVDDRIELQLASDHPELSMTLENADMRQLVMQETLATSLNAAELTDAYATVARVEATELAIKLRKAV